ncbi:MAG: aminopeptidase P N-terminal domain-containing protein [Bacilli bacterium]|nr:aminopeptidase P N-terminal domain-containing protein [Bacilli bacterium]
MIPVKEYAERRQRLLDKMEEGSVLVLFSGVAKKSSADDCYPFEVNRNFLYLTGITQEDSVLLLVNSVGEKKEYLFISPFDPVKEKWYGKKLTQEEAKDASGIHNVLLNGSLSAKLDTILNPERAEYGEINKVYIDLDPEQKIAERTDTEDYCDTLQKIYPSIQIENAFGLIVPLRMIKSDAEIQEFRAAIETTKQGVLSVMAKTRPGVKEWELADEFLKTVNDDSGYQGLSFNTIMASGEHAAILHYPHPLGKCDDGDLLLMDLGSRCNYYNADVSRTIPVNGKFDDFQRTLYTIVLECNKAVAKFARPGLTIKDLQAFTIEFLSSECLAKGIISKKEDISNYYFHNISHYIGLDTHDVGDRSLPLQPGNVISDEPGLYIREKHIGIRIEDDLLITEDGCEVLTAGIMKEISDIEKFYGNR